MHENDPGMRFAVRDIRVIGPYLFENEAEATVTVDGLCYREKINIFY